MNLPNMGVGNDFIVSRPKIRIAAPVAMPAAAPVALSVAPKPVLEDLDLSFEALPSKSLPGKVFYFFHKYSVGVFAVLFLAVAAAGITVGGSYWTARISNQTAALPIRHSLVQPKQGPNTSVKTNDLDVTLQNVSSQPLSLIVADRTVPISADTIRSWLKTASGKSGISYIHVDQNLVTKSLTEKVKSFAKAPVNQVVSTAPDDTQKIIATGRNGLKIGDVTPLAQQVSRDLLSAKGMQLTIPTESQAFAVVTPASFDKLIEVNVDTKQMWLYDKGVLYKQFPISAGAPATPTPIGQFQIYSKLAVQDMRGYNPNGTKYFQPHVRWINYFLPGGYAVHGNYWRPQSWFGAINSSHGCVSLPDDQAKVVYDWAPLGTTVITHN